ncbi:hypothetical protein QQS21_006263 [Conoideocrella luteorostrata]|uniref:FAD-binding FR-type domain-containing protein n=1 Tax=Conoideocrella luteorostrata TaxID=1105319 RepID=A0AAJ0CMW4_9HYPO|nr:hypothetical protein QQS21_006263 [Conoideocrella luteorostrata]
MAGGGEHNEAQLLRSFAIRAKKNEETTLGFILVLAGIGLLFTLFHLIRQSNHWLMRRTGASKLPSFITAIPRSIRKLSLRRAIGLPSLGHATIVTIFFALNVVGLLVNLDNKAMALVTNIASRSAWLAVANLLFVIFFALKNTPLAFLTAWSYERLNCLHRISGYAAVVHTIVHTVCYSYYFPSVGRGSMLLRTSDIMGIVAGGSWVLLALAAVLIRRWWYELFYYLHVVLWMVSIVTLALHQPRLATKVAIGTVVAGAMWGLDRIIRLFRLMIHSTNNTATLTPLPNGGTRVTLSKMPMGAISGKHAFLWIPRIRLFETHPFTIASADPLEFVIASQVGFTGDLHKYALANPGVPLKASIEGPYGTVPDPSAFETVVLVAGGSGASFTIGLAHAVLRRITRNTTKRVVFIWVVKYNSYLKWFADHLITLGNDARFSILVFVTRSDPPQSRLGSDASISKEMEKISINNAYVDKSQMRIIHPSSLSSSIDLEQSRRPSDNDSIFTSSSCRPVDFHGIPINYQRPDVATIIREAIGDTSVDERVLVTGCGPAKLMHLMRETTTDCIQAEGPSIELHCEQFGW